MFKIWAKIITDGKIEKQLTYEREDKFSYSDFFTYLADICEGLDIATPVLIKTHIFCKNRSGRRYDPPCALVVASEY